MKVPKRLQPLLEDGLIDAVVRQLMSGKEANVYVVRSGGEIRCAKVYKEATQRSFRQSVTYTEGRKVKNSRRARAMEKGGRYGRKAQEDTWHSTEVDALYRLAAAGVRVPKPYQFYEGVLLMELVTNGQGEVAPRLCDLQLSEGEARDYHAALIAQVVRMLCAGLVHGDLSEFNVLIGGEGPVIIDLPQALDAAGNNQAGSMLIRDLSHLATYFSRFAPELQATEYGKEMWALYQSGELHPLSELTGIFKRSEQAADVDGVLREVEAASDEQEARQRGRRETES